MHTNLHSRGAQFVFLDGHAQRFPVAVYWDLAANTANLVWIPN